MVFQGYYEVNENKKCIILNEFAISDKGRLSAIGFDHSNN